MNTNSESWRRECEIRFVLRMSKDERTAYYMDVARIRGEPSARALMSAVSEYWRARVSMQSTESMFLRSTFDVTCLSPGK